MFDEQVSTYFLSHSVVLNVSLFFYVQDVGPEFFRMLDEPLVVLELPGSIVVIMTFHHQELHHQMLFFLHHPNYHQPVYLLITIFLSANPVKEREVSLHYEGAECGHAKRTEHPGQV